MRDNEIQDMYEKLLSVEKMLEESILEKSDGPVTEDDTDENVDYGHMHVEGTPLFDEYYSARVFNALADKLIEREEKADGSPCWPGYKQLGMKKGKNGKMVPNCVPMDAKDEKSALKDPDGGLTAAGRAHFKKTQGANLKPGVRGPADTPEKMRRKGSFLTRFFTNPSGPMVDEKGRATRLALSAAAWGERVPKNAEDASALAAKGRRLLERYENSKKKSDEFDSLEIKDDKSALGQSIGQRSGGAPPPGSNPEDEVDRDGDGNIFDGTENEQAKPQKQREPYKKLSNSFLEKRRRREVQRELRRQGITPTRMGRIVPEEDGKGQIQNQIYDRPKKERDARAAARANFNQDADRKRFVRNQLKKQGIAANAKKEDRDEKERAARRAARAEYDKRVRAGEPKKPKTSSSPAPKPKPPYPKGYEPGKPADRYPDPPKPRDPEAERMERLRPKPRDIKPADRYPNPSKPRDAEAERMERLRPKPRDIKPADRYPNPSKPRDAEAERMERMRPKKRDPKPADRYPSPKPKRTGKNFGEMV